MPSSWSPSLRFELQFTGENINLWGEKLNAVLGHADYAVAGWLTKPLTGNTTLTSANAADDEARAAMLKFTGGAGPFTVTIPPVSKAYLVWNACAGPVTLTTGAGGTVSIISGEFAMVACSGFGVYRLASQSMAGARIQDVGIPTSDSDAATKAYVDDVAWTYNSGALPAQAGNAGRFVTTDGSSASWVRIIDTDVSLRRRRLLFKEMI